MRKKKGEKKEGEEMGRVVEIKWKRKEEEGKGDEWAGLD